MEDHGLEYELTICEIERERDFWLEARASKERAGGWDGLLNMAFNQHDLRMNYLLEELFNRMGSLALAGTEDGKG